MTQAVNDLPGFDCIWTDPPYGVTYVGKTADALTIQSDTNGDDAIAVTTQALTIAYQLAAPGAAFYVAHPAGALAPRFHKAMTDAGIRFKQSLVWVKNTFALGHADYHYRHEPILYGCKPAEGRVGRGSEYWYGDNAQDSVFEIPKPLANREHPTMKPIELVQAMLKNSCPRKGWVYDPFGGSGSTLMAAHGLGMNAVTVELDPKYADVICKRYQQATGQQPAKNGKPNNFLEQED